MCENKKKKKKKKKEITQVCKVSKSVWKLKLTKFNRAIQRSNLNISATTRPKIKQEVQGLQAFALGTLFL